MKQPNGCKLGLITSHTITSADDICIFSSSIESLQELFNIFTREFQLINLKINLNKSCCIKFSNNKKPFINDNCGKLNSKKISLI